MGMLQNMMESLRFNRQQKAERKTIYDRKDENLRGVYGKLKDHRKLKSHEFAAFQKKLFKRRLREEKSDRRTVLLALLIAVVIVILFLVFVYNYDFSLLNPATPEA